MNNYIRNLKSFALVTIPAVLIALVGAEIALRVWWGTQPFAGLFSESAPALAWFSKYSKLNRLGFRGKLSSYEKPPETFRMVVLGDSITFGYGIENEDERFPELLAGMLSKRLDTNIEAVNLGLPGKNTIQEYAIMRDVGRAFHPDMVILGYFYNDPESPLQVRLIAQLIYLPKVIQFFVMRSYLAAFAHLFLERSRVEGFYTKYVHYINAPNAPNVSQFREALKGIYELSNEQGADFAVVIFPILTGLEKDPYEFQDADDLIVGELKSLEVPYVDILPLLKGRNSRDLWVSELDAHPNEEVHYIAARALLPVVEPMIARRMKNMTRLQK